MTINDIPNSIPKAPPIYITRDKKCRQVEVVCVVCSRGGGGLANPNNCNASYLPWTERETDDKVARQLALLQAL